MKKYLEIFAFVALSIWEAISFVQGAAISFFIQGTDQPAAALLIGLLYGSVILAFALGIFLARVAAYLLLCIAIGLALYFMLSNVLAHGPLTAEALLISVLMKPFLASLILFILPAIGPVERFRRRNDSGR